VGTIGSVGTLVERVWDLEILLTWYSSFFLCTFWLLFFHLYLGTFPWRTSSVLLDIFTATFA